MRLEKQTSFGNLNALIGQPYENDGEEFVDVILWKDAQLVNCLLSIYKEDDKIQEILIRTEKTFEDASLRSQNFSWEPKEGILGSQAKTFFERVLPGSKDDFLSMIAEIVSGIEARKPREFSDSEYTQMIEAVGCLKDGVKRSDFAKKDKYDAIAENLKSGKILAEDFPIIKEGVQSAVNRWGCESDRKLLQKLAAVDAIRE